MRISKRSLDDLLKRWAAAAGNGGPSSREVIWDDAVAGFCVRRRKEGGCSFLVKYRVKGSGTQRLVTLGDYPSMHPDVAREEARRIKEAAALGRDLVAERRLEAERAAAAAAEVRRHAIPLEALLDAWRAVTQATIERKEAAGQSAVYERELLRLEGKHLRPAVAGQVVGTFDPDSLQAILDRATGHSAALNLRNLFSRVAKFARPWLAERGLRVNWARRYEAVHQRPAGRDHRYSLEEAARIWMAAGGLGRPGAAIRFMLLVGCRRSEAARVRWDHVHLDDAVRGAHVEIPAALVKHRRLTLVPLSPPAVALLRWLPRRTSRRFGDADLVFAGRANKAMGGWSGLLRTLLGLARVEEGWFHDIRRTVVSTLGDHGWDLAVVDRLLNHASSASMGGVLGVYQRSELWQQQRQAVEAWADLLLAEVGRLQGAPLQAASWAPGAPFTEVAVRRVRVSGSPASAPSPAKRKGRTARSRRVAPSASIPGPSRDRPGRAGA